MIRPHLTPIRNLRQRRLLGAYYLSVVEQRNQYDPADDVPQGGGQQEPAEILRPSLLAGEDAYEELRGVRSIMMTKTTNTISVTLNKTVSMLWMTMALHLQAFEPQMRKGPG